VETVVSASKRWLHWALIGLGGLAGLLGMALLGVYLYTERAMRVAPPSVALGQLPAGDVSAGARLTVVLGCRGCHMEDLGGQVFVDIPNVARLVAPNLTQLRSTYDHEAFLRLMRAGTKADGRLALVMPNKAHQRLTDRQLADLFAYFRSVPPVERSLPTSTLRPLGRLGIALGEYDLDDMRADPPESPVVLADRKESDLGRHLALVTCSECHGIDFAGFPEEGSPPLLIAKAYSKDEFTRLMREGLTKTGAESASGLMTEVARTRFVHFTDEEIASLKAFLDQR
jgi:mono/diheme cytochrome c family protein